MRTFHQDTNKILASNLKTAVKNTMQAVVRVGKALPSCLQKGVIVLAATFVMSTPNAQAQGFIDKALNGVTKALYKIEKTAQDIGRPFYTLNRQFDLTEQAIEYTESDIRGTGERFGRVVAPVVNTVNAIRDQRKANQYLQQMEGQNIPLIAEEGGQTYSVSSGDQRMVYSNSTGLNVVGEVSLDELMSRGNTTVSSSAANVAGITLDELAAYTNSHSSSNGSSAAAVRARKAEVQGQSVGGSGTQKTSQVKKQTRKLSTEELYAQMVKEGYVK